MHINSIQPKLPRHKTSFKSKLPDIKATYNINPLEAEVIPDYWPKLTENCDPKQRAKLKELLTKLTENFDNNVLALSSVKGISGDSYFYSFRLYKNTDELLKHARSRTEFMTEKNYYNYQILIGKTRQDECAVSYANTVVNYGKCGNIDALLNVLSNIVSSKTNEHKVIYNTYNQEEEMFLKNFREKA